MFTCQNVTISVMQAAAEAGVAAVGYDSLAGQRLTIPALLDRWHQQSAPAAPRERPASRCRAEASHRNGNATGTVPAKDTASQSIWITAGTDEDEYCSEDVGFWSTWLCRADTQIEHSQIVGIDAYAVGWCAPMKRPAEQWNWPHHSA